MADYGKIREAIEDEASEHSLHIRTGACSCGALLVWGTKTRHMGNPHAAHNEHVAEKITERLFREGLVQ